MRSVRTTVNIDDSLLAEAKQVAAREHRTLGSVLDEALGRFLRPVGTSGEKFRLPNFNPGHPGPRPGVDINNSRQLAELLGDDERPAGL